MWKGRDIICQLFETFPIPIPFTKVFLWSLPFEPNIMALERNRARDRPVTRLQSSNVLDGREEEEEDVWCWNNDVSSTAMIWWCGRLDTLAGQWYYNYLSSYVQISSLHLVLYWRHWRVCCGHRQSSDMSYCGCGGQCSIYQSKNIKLFTSTSSSCKWRNIFLTFWLIFLLLRNIFHNFLVHCHQEPHVEYKY